MNKTVHTFAACYCCWYCAYLLGSSSSSLVAAFAGLPAVSVAFPRLPRWADDVLGKPEAVPQDKETAQQQQHPQQSLPLASATSATALPKITSYEQAMQIIDESAQSEEPLPLTYPAVRFVEKNAYKLYPDMASRQALWERAQGQFKFVLSTGGPKTRAFHIPPYPFPFSYAMIKDGYFGNGFGLSEDLVVVSCLQKHYFNPRIRQMVVTVQDMYMGGFKATPWVPSFIKKALHVGKTPADFAATRTKAPAFCIVAATEHALVARGNQSGSLAIWKRFPTNAKDIRLSAYRGLLPEKEEAAASSSS